MPVTVAVLGAGSLFGQGIIKALKMSSLDVRIVALDFFPTAIGIYWVEHAYLLPDVLDPTVGEEHYFRRLMDVLNKEEVNVLLVATDFEIPRLARYRQKVEAETRCRVIVSSPEVAGIGDDKWATYQFLKGRGFPCPPSLIDLGGLDDFINEVGFPIIVKPRRGARSHGVSLVEDRSGLDAALRAAGSDPIIQQAVGSPDREYTCGAVVLDGSCTGVMVLRRDLRDGNTFRAFLEPQPRLEELVREAALALNPCGPVNFQLRVDEKGPAIYEINTRFSGTTVMRALSGFNEVEAVVRWAVSGERIPLRCDKKGVFLRYWDELFLPWEEYNRMREVGAR